VAVRVLALCASVLTGDGLWRPVQAQSGAAPAPAPAREVGPLRDTAAAAARWVRDRAVPLRATRPDADDAGLRALDGVVAGARLVALGEGTHGTHEFFELKRLLFERLVRQHGVTVLALELSFAKARRLDDYVQGGRGTAEAALLETASWVWSTTELAGLLDWIRAYNARAAAGRRITVVGFDALNARAELQPALEYVRRLDSVGVAPLLHPFGAVVGWDPLAPNTTGVFDDLPGTLTPIQLERLAAAVAQVGDHLDRERASLVRRSSEREWRRARLHARFAHQRTRQLLGVNAWFSSLGPEAEGALFRRVPGAADSLRSFLSRRSTPPTGTLDTLLTALRAPRRALLQYRRTMAWRERAAWHAAAAELRATLAVTERTGTARGASRDEWSRAVSAAEDVVRALDAMREYLNKTETFAQSDPRDPLLAENITAILDLEGPTAKAAVWVHNAHAFRGPHADGADRMGTVLARRFGDQYRVVVTAFGQGSFQARDFSGPSGGTPPRVRSLTVGPPPDTTHNGVLSGAGAPTVVLDVRRPPTEARAAAWFAAPRAWRDIGNRFDGADARHYVPLKVPEHFDAVVFVERTTRARPTPAAVQALGVEP
jgi:erythromycin esterase-like protein